MRDTEETDYTELWFEEYVESPSGVIESTYDQACAQYERAEKLEALLAAERGRREQAERERDVLRKVAILRREWLGAMDLATTWRTERAQYQGRIAELEAELLPLRAIAEAAVAYYPDGGVICKVCGWDATTGVAHDRGCPVQEWEAERGQAR